MEIFKTYYEYKPEQNRNRKMAIGICPACNKEHKGTYSNIKYGKSCGCQRAEQARKNGRTRTTKQAFTNSKHNAYKQSAIKRNIYFELSPNDVEILITQDCSYCGAKPSLTDAKYFKGIPYPTNSIDRIDSNKGYTKNNTQPCCVTCNIMKNSLSSQEFLDHIRKVFVFNER